VASRASSLCVNETFYDAMNNDGGFLSHVKPSMDRVSLAALGLSLLMYLLIQIVICEIVTN